MGVVSEDTQGPREELESYEMTYTRHDLAEEQEQPSYPAAILNGTHPVVSGEKLTGFGSLIHDCISYYPASPYLVVSVEAFACHPAVAVVHFSSVRD